MRPPLSSEGPATGNEISIQHADDVRQAHNFYNTAPNRIIFLHISSQSLNLHIPLVSEFFRPSVLQISTSRISEIHIYTLLELQKF